MGEIALVRVYDPPASGRVFLVERLWPRGVRRDALRQSPEVLGVADVAALTSLHPNTARFHLDALTEDGLAVRTIETRASPGRPRVLYAARAEAMDQRSYGLLAEMLAWLAATADDAREAAVATGRSCGRQLAPWIRLG